MTSIGLILAKGPRAAEPRTNALISIKMNGFIMTIPPFKKQYVHKMNVHPVQNEYVFAIFL